MRVFKVKSGESTKKFSIKDADSITEEGLRNLFRIKDCDDVIIQVFDPDLVINDFLDITKEEMLSPDKLPSNILKVKVLAAPYKISISEIGQSLKTRDFSKRNGANNSSTITVSNNKEPFTYKGLQSSYKLPFFDEESKLGHALKTHQPLKPTSLQSQFTSKIFDSFSQRKHFYFGVDGAPTLIRVVDAILIKYPYLGNGLDYIEASNIWATLLKYKFGYKRKSFGNATSVQERKNSGGKRSQTISTDSSYGEMYGIPNYNPPPNSEEDDDQCFNDHLRWLNSVRMLPMTPEHVVLKKVMDATFGRRRQFVVSTTGTEIPSVEEILDVYPCFQNEGQIIMEMSRLMGADLNTPYLSKIVSFEEKFNSSMDYIAKKSVHKEYLKNLIPVHNLEDSRRKKFFTLLGKIALMLREDPKTIIGTSHEENRQPKVIFNQGKIGISIQGKMLCYIEDVRQIPFIWLSSFLVFNIKADAKCSKTFNFLKCIILGLKLKNINNVNVAMRRLFELN